MPASGTFDKGVDFSTLLSLHVHSKCVLMKNKSHHSVALVGKVITASLCFVAGSALNPWLTCVSAEDAKPAANQVAAPIAAPAPVPSADNQKKLIEALQKKDYPGLKALLDAGADPLAASEKGEPPFFAAINAEDLEAVGIFLDRKVNPEFTTGKARHTPLMIAAEKSNFELFSLLLKHGAKLDAKNANGMSVLGYAFTGFLNSARLEGREKIIKAIREGGWTEPAKLGAAPFAEKDKPELLTQGPGAEVGRFVVGSAADKLKLLPGDVIVSIDEVPIQNFKHLMTIVSAKKALDPVKMTVTRKKETIVLAGELGPAVVGPFR